MGTSLSTAGVTFPDSSVQSTAAFGIGPLQTWVNQTAFRAETTVYTNTSSTPIMVSIICSAGNVTIEASLIVDGLTVCRYENNPNNSNIRCTVVGIVPVGSTYQLIKSSNATIDKWSELL